MDSTESGLGWWSSPVSGDDGTFDGECSIVYDIALDAKTIGLVFTFMDGYQPAVGGMRIRASDLETKFTRFETATRNWA